MLLNILYEFVYTHKCGQEILVREYNDHSFEYYCESKHVWVCPKCDKEILVWDLKGFGGTDAG